ncbi:MAG: VTT domain-containing protein [Gammaproteobacteria bacterium]|nr:VTT domain-containing protein [Gammaproteobacteria bacterium]
MQFLIEYGYILLFLLIFLDQAGLPLPSLPGILAAGALAGSGEMNLPGVILVAVLACVPADFVWYYLGRTRGGKVLTTICNISLEPDYCVQRTERSFEQLGSYALLVAKFVPGLQTIAPPMAGLTGMPVLRFLTLDTAGAALWAAVVAWLGFLFSSQLTEIAVRFVELGGLAAGILVGALVLFAIIKWLQRRAFVRSLRMRTLEPGEVHEKLQAGEPVYLIDLRHRLDFNAFPYSVPGAVRVPMEHIDEHHDFIPRDRDIVLYCS